MKKFAKFALGAAVLAGAAMIAVGPAEGRVSVGVGIGVGPGYYGAPAPAYTCDPYSRFYDPYYCGYYGPAYYGYGPGLVIGGRFGGSFRGGPLASGTGGPYR